MQKIKSGIISNLLTSSAIETLDQLEEAQLEEGVDYEKWYVYDLTDTFNNTNRITLSTNNDAKTLIRLSNPQVVIGFYASPDDNSFDDSNNNALYSEKEMTHSITKYVYIKYNKEKKITNNFLNEDGTTETKEYYSDRFDFENRFYAFTQQKDPLFFTTYNVFFNSKEVSRLNDPQDEREVYQLVLSQINTLPVGENSQVQLVFNDKFALPIQDNKKLMYSISTADDIVFGTPDNIAILENGTTSHVRTNAYNKNPDSVANISTSLADKWIPFNINVDQTNNISIRLWSSNFDKTKTWDFWNRRWFKQGFTYNGQSYGPNLFPQTEFKSFKGILATDFNNGIWTGSNIYLNFLLYRIYEFCIVDKLNYVGVPQVDDSSAGQANALLAGNRIRAMVGGKTVNDKIALVNAMINATKSKAIANQVFAGWQNADNLFYFTGLPSNTDNYIITPPTQEDWNRFYGILASMCTFIYSEEAYEGGGNDIIKSKDLLFFDEISKQTDVNVAYGMITLNTVNASGIWSINHTNNDAGINIKIDSSFAKVSSLADYFGASYRKPIQFVQPNTPSSLWDPVNNLAYSLFDGWNLNHTDDYFRQSLVLGWVLPWLIGDRPLAWWGELIPIKGEVDTWFVYLNRGGDPSSPDLPNQGTAGDTPLPAKSTDKLLGKIFGYKPSIDLNYAYGSENKFIITEEDIITNKLTHITAVTRNFGMSGNRKFYNIEIPQIKEILTIYNSLSVSDRSSFKVTLTLTINSFVNYHKDFKRRGAYIRKVEGEATWTKSGTYNLLPFITPKLRMSNIGTEIINSDRFFRSYVSTGEPLETQELPTLQSNIQNTNIYDNTWVMMTYEDAVSLYGNMNHPEAPYFNFSHIPLGTKTMFCEFQEKIQAITHIILNHYGSGRIVLTIHDREDPRNNIEIPLQISGDLNNTLTQTIIKL